MKTALITGVNGQDGSYLAELLLQKEYRVAGTIRNGGSDLGRIHHLRKDIEIVETDLLNQAALEDLLLKFEPAEVYNLAARASGRELWIHPVQTGEVNGMGVTRWLEAIQRVNSKIRFCQASSSEIFGNAAETPQTEVTPICPRNPYAAAKAYAHWITASCRESRNLFACSAILFNHESPRRGLEFVTRKISHSAARIRLGLAAELRLGSLEARRDWGFAGDCVEAMWRMLQQEKPDDYIIATGETHSVREFCQIAFSHVGLDYRDFVVHDPENDRAAEAAVRVGNAAKARRSLGWNPSVTFPSLVRMMVDSDLRSLHELPQAAAAAQPLQPAPQEHHPGTRGEA